MTNTEICPFCGTPSATLFLENARDYITEDLFCVYQCGTCLLGMTSPRPGNLEKYYPHQYRRYNIVILWILKCLYRIRARYWGLLFPTPGCVLEVGCGDGLMLNALKEQGWQPIGIERTAAMGEHARKHFGIQVYEGNVQELPAEFRFDLIILFQVLEHVADPLSLLVQCEQRLNDGGKIVIGVPNFDSIQARYSRACWFHLDVPRHLFHYSPMALQGALKKVGMEIVHQDFVSFEHDPYGWIQSTFNKCCNDRNRLTRILMKIDPVGLRGFVSLMVAVILAGPSLLLSIATWFLRCGAILQVLCVRSAAGTPQ